jgi:integrase
VTDPKDITGAVAAVAALVAKLMDPDAPKEREGTIAELIPQYLEDATLRLRPRTVVNAKGLLAWVDRCWGFMTPAQIDPLAVERAAKAKGWKKNTVRKVLATAQTFLRWAGRSRVKFRMPAPEYRGAECVVTADDYGRLLTVAHGDFANFLRLMWLTGCRPGEVRALTANAVDWSGGTVMLSEHKTSGKTGRKRLIALPGEAVEVLTAQRDKYSNSGHLFRGRYKQPLTLAGVRIRWVNCCKAAGLVYPTVYGLRHSFAVRALESGESSVTVAGLLGHTTTAMVERVYGHLTSNTRRLRDAAERISRAG